MSDGGHPAVRSEITVCCSKNQFLVNPIKMGVTSLICFLGGVFHCGTGGRSVGDRALAAAGKVSFIRTKGRAARGRMVSFLYFILGPASISISSIGCDGGSSCGIGSGCAVDCSVEDNATSSSDVLSPMSHFHEPTGYSPAFPIPKRCGKKYVMSRHDEITVATTMTLNCMRQREDISRTN